MHQQGSNQQAANSAIAVWVRVSGFKLHMYQRDFDEWWQICSGMDEMLHVAQQRANLL